MKKIVYSMKKLRKVQIFCSRLKITVFARSSNITMMFDDLHAETYHPEGCFRKNKPNVKIGNINISSLVTSKYAKMAKNQSSIINNHLKSKPNQTQYKANSNPICLNAIIGLRPFMTSKYKHLSHWRDKKQTQNKPDSNPIFQRGEYMLMTKKSIFAITIALLFQIQAFSADWPQWRGVNRDGIWNEEGIVQKFAHKQLPIRWRAKIANGYSGPTVAKGRVYVTDRLTSPGQIERVLCFNAMTGDEIWSHSYECNYKKVGYPNGPRASVTVNDGRAYSLGSMGHLFCFNAAKGNVLWSKDLYTEYKIRMPVWGIAASPLVEANFVIVQIGGRNGACLVAFDKVSGQEKWRALSDNASYSAPVIIEQAGKRVLVCLTGDRIVGLDPLNGNLYWQHPFAPVEMVISIATPVFENNHLFISSFYDGSLLLKVNPDELSVEQVWRRRGKSEKITDSLHCCISTPVLRGDYIYGVDSYGQLRCLDLKTGDRIWESLDATPNERWSNIHMVKHEDRIWMFNERGELIISKLSPQGFHEISRTKLIEPTTGQLSRRGKGVCWSHPAFANGHIYIRNDKELVCADLSIKNKKPPINR